MTLIKDVFQNDVSRPISPVIYFHEDSPEKLAQEVSEYIITGGYDDGNHDGIHEQYVRLLKGILRELKAGGCENPACWISGFYGSGKSSFAKLLGLALDKRLLPDGTPLAEALLARDDSPKQGDFRKLWQELQEEVDAMAVVFDIGAVARDGEPIHLALKRQLAKRLNYCPHPNQAIAEYELSLEKDGLYPKFLELYEQEFGRSWESSKTRGLVQDEFSQVMAKLFPQRYDTAYDWADQTSGTFSTIGTSVDDVARSISDMLKQRAPGKTVFIVIDEVSQYIHTDDHRMLTLQSLVSAMGQRFKGKLWLLATGQQKLDEESEGSSLPKLKGRFPNSLRVHLSPANIRDVVHKRLLKKRVDKYQELRNLFTLHGPKLRLYGFKTERITEAEFIEVYPMLPGQVELLMQISSNLRLRSSRVKGDDHAIRGLLQLLVELFREKNLGQLELGRLITIDLIYDVQASNLDADIQNTMARLFNDPSFKEDHLAQRVAKAIALLEVASEHYPTTVELISSCLYQRLGDDSLFSEVKTAIERLKLANLVQDVGESGYKIQSSAAQEWAAKRDLLPANMADVTEEIKVKLKELIGKIQGKPKLKDQPFSITAFFSSSKEFERQRFISPNDQATVNFEFSFFESKNQREEKDWKIHSGDQARKYTVFWVNGEPNDLVGQIRALIRSRRMVSDNQLRRTSLSPGERSCLTNEEQRVFSLNREVEKRIEETYLNGKAYFQGLVINDRQLGLSLASVCQQLAEDVLPRIFTFFLNLAISDSELEQLLSPDLSGISVKFYEKGLGVLKVDSGKAMPSCEGAVPSRVLELINERNGCSGSELIDYLGAPPYGYYQDLVRASTLGLLRAGKIELEASGKITSYRDPGCKDVFLKLQQFKKVKINLANDTGPSPRRVQAMICFFESNFNTQLSNEKESIADALYQYFPKLNEEIQEFYKKLERLHPLKLTLPESLSKLPKLLEDCKRYRTVDEILKSLDRNLDAIENGIVYLRKLDQQLFKEVLDEVAKANNIYQHLWHQLENYGAPQELKEIAHSLAEKLRSEKPWDERQQLKEEAFRIEEVYREVRSSLLRQQEDRFELARQKFREQEDLSDLTPEQKIQVLHPFDDGKIKTDVASNYPELVTLRDNQQLKLDKAIVSATKRLDNIRDELDKASTVPVQLDLYGKLVSSESEIDELLAKLKERLMSELKNKDSKIKVRLV